MFILKSIESVELKENFLVINGKELNFGALTEDDKEVLNTMISKGSKYLPLLYLNSKYVLESVDGKKLNKIEYLSYLLECKKFKKVGVKESNTQLRPLTNVENLEILEGDNSIYFGKEGKLFKEKLNEGQLWGEYYSKEDMDYEKKLMKEMKEYADNLIQAFKDAGWTYDGSSADWGHYKFSKDGVNAEYCDTFDKMGSADIESEVLRGLTGDERERYGFDEGNVGDDYAFIDFRWSHPYPEKVVRFVEYAMSKSLNEGANPDRAAVDDPALNAEEEAELDSLYDREIKEYVCKNCGKVIPNIHDWDKKHYKEYGNEYYCPYCGEPYTFKEVEDMAVFKEATDTEEPKEGFIVFQSGGMLGDSHDLEDKVFKTKEEAKAALKLWKDSYGRNKSYYKPEGSIYKYKGKTAKETKEEFAKKFGLKEGAYPNFDLPGGYSQDVYDKYFEYTKDIDLVEDEPLDFNEWYKSNGGDIKEVSPEELGAMLDLLDKGEAPSANKVLCANGDELVAIKSNGEDTLIQTFDLRDEGYARGWLNDKVDYEDFRLLKKRMNESVEENFRDMVMELHSYVEADPKRILQDLKAAIKNNKLDDYLKSKAAMSDDEVKDFKERYLKESIDDHFDRFIKDLKTALLDNGFKISNDNSNSFVVSFSEGNLQIRFYSADDINSPFENEEAIGIGGDLGDKTVYPYSTKGWESMGPEEGPRVDSIFKRLKDTKIDEVIDIVYKAFDEVIENYKNQTGKGLEESAEGGHTIIKACPMCDKEYSMELTDDEYNRYEEYLDGGKLIQDLFPEMLPVEREFLKSGYCPECQELLFANESGSSRIKEVIKEGTGTQVGDIAPEEDYIKPLVKVENRKKKKIVKESAETYTDEEKAEYGLDDEGYDENGDLWIHCAWCGELHPISDCRKEVNLGWICKGCQDALYSRGEKAVYEDGADYFEESVKEDAANINDIEYVEPNYTGGGVYVYTGKLKDGNYFLGGDDWFDKDNKMFMIRVVNADPDKCEDDECWYDDWQKEHLVRDLTEEENKEITKQILHWIIENKPDGNYDIRNMEYMLNIVEPDRLEEIDEHLLDLLRMKERLSYDGSISDEIAYDSMERIDNELVNSYSEEEIEKAKEKLGLNESILTEATISNEEVVNKALNYIEKEYNELGTDDKGFLLSALTRGNSAENKIKKALNYMINEYNEIGSDDRYFLYNILTSTGIFAKNDPNREEAKEEEPKERKKPELSYNKKKKSIVLEKFNELLNPKNITVVSGTGGSGSSIRFIPGDSKIGIKAQMQSMKLPGDEFALSFNNTTAKKFIDKLDPLYDLSSGTYTENLGASFAGDFVFYKYEIKDIEAMSKVIEDILVPKVVEESLNVGDKISFYSNGYKTNGKWSNKRDIKMNTEVTKVLPNGAVSAKDPQGEKGFDYISPEEITEVNGELNPKLEYFAQVYYSHDNGDHDHKWNKKEIKDWVKDEIEMGNDMFDLDSDTLNMLYQFQHELYQEDKEEGLI